MKQFYNLLSILMVASITLLISCNDEEAAEPLVGKWRFSSVAIAQDYTFAGTDITIPVGVNITAGVSEALYSVAQCSNASLGAIELKASNQLSIICSDGSSDVTAGTWAKNSATELALNLTVPSAISLNIGGVVVNGSTLSGSIAGLPISKATYGPLLLSLAPQLDLTPFPDVILLNVSVSFTKI